MGGQGTREALMPNPYSADYVKRLMADARAAYAYYLRKRYELRGLGVTEASLALLEAGEHHSYDLTVQQHVDVSGNLLGPEH